MSQSIATSLQKEVQERIASTSDELLLYLRTVDQCLIPEEEYSHLIHLGRYGEKMLQVLGREYSFTRYIRARENAASIKASI